MFVNARDGRIAQWVLTDADGDGRIEGSMVRQWDVGTEVEGCVADDELGALYISEENVAIWKYGAEPTDPTTTASRVAVDRTIAAGGHIRPDAEGLTIVYQPGTTGYLIASSQAASDTLNSYLVLRTARSQCLHPELPSHERRDRRRMRSDRWRRRPGGGSRTRLPERHVRLSRQQQHRTGKQRESELQVGSAGTSRGSVQRAAS